MRVAILRRAYRASVSMDVYTDGLVRGLKAIRPNWEIVELAPSAYPDNLGKPAWLRGLQKYYARYWLYPITLRHQDVDLFHIIDHSDGYLTYWLNKNHKPRIITCHDIINLIQPETFKKHVRFPLVNMTAWRLSINGLCAADQIISVSSHTAKDVIQNLKINPEKITVIPNAVDTIFRPLKLDEICSFRKSQKLSSDTLCLLNVGSNHPRKNIATILEVLLILKKRNLPIHLWKVGTDFNTEQKSFIQKHSLERYVTYLGAPNKTTLVQVYNAADVLVAPSVYEGFGLTILEAMACGTAVVTSNVSSLPEVAGDAAILLAPLDVKEIASTLHQLYGDPEYRQELVQKGLERVKQFTWKNTAEQVANVYEKVLLKQH